MAEDPHRAIACELAPIAFDAQQAPFAKSGDIHPGIGGDELLDALLARLAGVAVGMGVEVVGVDLERQEARRGKRRGFDDGHVVGGADRGAGDVAARAPTHVRRSELAHCHAHGFDETLFVHLFEEREGVAAADNHGFGLADGPCGVGGAVNRAHFDAEVVETLLHARLVFVIRKSNRRVGYEGYRFGASPEEFPDVLERPLQIGLAGGGGVGDKE